MVGSRACRGIGLGRMRIIGRRQSWLRMPERLGIDCPIWNLQTSYRFPFLGLSA